MCSEQACAIIFCCEVSACDLSYSMGKRSAEYFDRFGSGRGILPILVEASFTKQRGYEVTIIIYFGNF